MHPPVKPTPYPAKGQYTERKKIPPVACTPSKGASKGRPPPVSYASPAKRPKNIADVHTRPLVDRSSLATINRSSSHPIPPVQTCSAANSKMSSAATAVDELFDDDDDDLLCAIADEVESQYGKCEKN